MGLTSAIFRPLKKARKISLDTSVLIYLFENHPKYGVLGEELFDLIRKYQMRVVISTLVFTELFVHPYKHNRPESIQKDLDFLRNYEVEVISVTPNIAIQAASLRARYHLSAPDAIHLSTALHEECDLFVSNDKSLRKVKEIKVFSLES